MGIQGTARVSNNNARQPGNSEWATEMREKLTEEFDISHVTESVFATVNQLHENISLLSKDLETSGRQGKKTLLVVCYRGGGGLDMRCLETYAIMQGGKAFPIEHLLRDLAKIQNCYVLGVLDCPRLRLETQIFDGYNFKDEEAKNLILMFGCKMMQNLKQSCTLPLFDLLARKRESEKRKFVTLPEELLFIEAVK